ncbi:hypothetical protein OLMES_0436 [Oleiphilus messinensis]|uniref:Cytochrome c domain-containing protein n=1 Tax=Oleiphilus messinensis TaxID=141451 RepID=A0A1Y0I2Q6_9GAMM|nr:c-type cytochrome [Oleiphilus messinensis]ARU54540.1 hypothetical protein OLMES_0436 [Oleiphilus messinensis]
MTRIQTLVSIAALTMGITACSDSEPEPPKLSPELKQGQDIVKANCFVCHGQGINGAPMIGNHKAWSPRIAQGMDTLVEHASNGFNMMPARGGNANLSDAEIRLAVGYMVSQVETP